MVPICGIEAPASAPQHVRPRQRPLVGDRDDHQAAGQREDHRVDVQHQALAEPVRQPAVRDGEQRVADDVGGRDLAGQRVGTGQPSSPAGRSRASSSRSAAGPRARWPRRRERRAWRRPGGRRRAPDHPTERPPVRSGPWRPPPRLVSCVTQSRTTRSCSSPSADPRSRTTSCRSCATSPPGRDIPDARLEEVGEHYFLFGGRSPINDQNRELVAAIEADLAANGVEGPRLLGQPQLGPLPARGPRADEGRRGHPRRGGADQRLLLLQRLSPVPREPRRRRRRGARCAPDRPAAPLLQPPGVHRADGRRHALRARRPARGRPTRRAHRVRHALDPGEHERLQRPARRRLRRPAPGRWPPRSSSACARRPGTATPPSWSSAPAPVRRRIPWLEPDVNDHLRSLRHRDVPGVVVVPIGFVSDHMEVVYDLDTEARATAEEIGLPFARAATAGRRPAVRRHGPRPAARARRRRAGRAARAGGGRLRPGLGRVPGRLLPQPARPEAGAVRRGLTR